MALVTPRRSALKRSAESRPMFRSFATTRPRSSIMAASWVVLLPGAAQASQTVSVGSGSSAIGGSVETASCVWIQPWKAGQVAPGLSVSRWRRSGCQSVGVASIPASAKASRTRSVSALIVFTRAVFPSGRSIASAKASNSSTIGRYRSRTSCIRLQPGVDRACGCRFGERGRGTGRVPGGSEHAAVPDH